jgi:hypothetical protein
MTWGQTNYHETIWGLVHVGFGILCYMAGWILSGFAMLIRIFVRLNKAAGW